MDGWVLRLLEGVSLGLFVWCLADAVSRGPRYVLELLAGGLFGLLVEQIAIGGGMGREDAYRYGPFVWMATRDVPLVIAGNWGALLYAALKYTDGLGLPHWVRPAVDGLYALMLDLTMDLVAVNLGLWQWAAPPETQYFGIPFSNFGGWLLAATLFSGGLRLARALQERYRTKDRHSLSGRTGLIPYAVILGLITAGLTALTPVLLGRIFSGSAQDVWPAGILAVLSVAQLAGGLVWRSRARPPELRLLLADAPTPSRIPDPAIGVPFLWHLTYHGLAVMTGVFLYRPALLFLTGTLASLGLLLVLALRPRRWGG